MPQQGSKFDFLVHIAVIEFFVLTLQFRNWGMELTKVCVRFLALGTLFCVAAAFGGILLPSGVAYAQTAPIINDYAAYRFYTFRRHNDMQGVEAVFDDYRRNWLMRTHSKVRVGGSYDLAHADTPTCSWSKRLSLSGRYRANCGNGHVMRAGVNGFVARQGSTTDEVGAIGYLGYEHLVSDRFFVGLGATFGSGKIEQRSRGETLDITTKDTGLHLIGAYRLRGQSMLAWNISLLQSDDDLTRNGTITGTHSSRALMVTGVWYKTFDLRRDRRLSLGIDYTLLRYYTGEFVDSSGATQTVPYDWRGDVTVSALLSKDLENGEAFARLGAQIEVLHYKPGTTFNWVSEFSDASLDIGRSYSLTDKIAFTGTVGAMLRKGGYQELRAGARLTMRF